MSNAYIPDQLHHMSKKELLEFAQTAHEENVRLVQQLAKANEWIEELEKEKEGLNLRIGKQKESIGRYAKEAIEIAKAQEQFAIEKKIEALSKLSAPLDYNVEHPEFCMKKRIEEEIEQLRKGGE